ncbi:MAG TPA: DegV family protein [Pilimelia sp.]|nr:DegV family protein [Pilimelia sp.]
MPVAVVTDSTAELPADLAATYGITVVPLLVVRDGVAGREGVDVGPADVARVLAARGTVTTSRPAPETFRAAYRRLLADGADAVVSVHLSARLSGTWDAARLAVAESPGRIEVVDTGMVGAALGFAALAAARTARAGGDAAAVRRAALAAADRTAVYFCLDTLEFLRRGGRMGAAVARLGTALSVRPILQLADGGIVARDRVRTGSRALARLVDLAAGAAGDGPADVVVAHLAARQRAEQVAAALAGRLAGRVGDLRVAEVGAVLAAHCGPGLTSVVVHRR